MMSVNIGIHTTMERKGNNMEELFKYIEELEWNEYKALHPKELDYHEVCRQLSYLMLIGKQEWEDIDA